MYLLDASRSIFETSDIIVISNSNILDIVADLYSFVLNFFREYDSKFFKSYKYLKRSFFNKRVSF